MPNVRKKSKKYISAWIDEKLYDELVEEAKLRGPKFSLTDLYIERLQAGVKKSAEAEKSGKKKN